MRTLILFTVCYNALAVEVIDDKVCFTKPEELKVRQMVMDKETCELREIQLKDLAVVDADLLKNKDNQINIHKSTEVELVKKLEYQQTQSKLEKTLWFIGGVLLGGSAVYLGSKVTGK